MSETEYAPIRLRRDAIYLKTEDGIFFRGPGGAFALKGKNIYDSFHALVPYMDGRVGKDAILRALKGEQRKPISDLLKVLVDRSIIQTVDMEDSRAIAPPLAESFAPQLSFIAHFSDRPCARFLAFHHSKILILGGGVSFLSAGIALLKNGLRTLHVDNSSNDNDVIARLEAECGKLAAKGLESMVVATEIGACTAPRDFDAVIYCAEQPDLALMHTLNAGARRHGYHFLPAFVLEGKSYIGPVTDPFIAGCWLCAMLRWTENETAERASRFWKRLAVATGLAPPAEELSDISALMLGNSVALEMFRFCIGKPGPEARFKVLKQDHVSLETSVVALIAHADCPLCERLPNVGAMPPEATYPASTDAKQRCLNKWAPLIGTEFGFFGNFSDESFEQIPLRVSLLDLKLASGHSDPLSTLGWSLENNNDARYQALCKAVVRKVTSAASRDLQARANTRGNAEAPLVDVAALAGWLGNSAHAAPVRYLMEAVDSSTGHKLLVPAGAIHRHFDVERYFDAHSAGVGAGLSAEDALREAIISSFEYLTLAALVDETLDVKRWRTEHGGHDQTTTYLLSAAANLGHPDIRIGLAQPREGVFAAIVLPEVDKLVTAEELVLASGFSLTEAINKALMEKVARLQLHRDKRPWTQTKTLGIFAVAPISIDATEDYTSLAADSHPQSVEQILTGLRSHGESVLSVDITQVDIAATESIRVVKALFARETARA